MNKGIIVLVVSAIGRGFITTLKKFAKTRIPYKDTWILLTFKKRKLLKELDYANKIQKEVFQEVKKFGLYFSLDKNMKGLETVIGQNETALSKVHTSLIDMKTSLSEINEALNTTLWSTWKSTL